VLAALTLGPLFLLPVAITVAIVKYRLYEIDTLINRTLVYGGLTGSVLAAYAIVVLLVASVSSATPEWRSSVLVVVVVTLVAYPVRDRMQRWVNQRMYGDRDDPARAMSRLGRRVADSVTPVELLSTVTETIGTTLRLPYVAVELVGTTSQITASYGRRPSDEPQRLELVHQGNRVGALLVGRRSPTEQFTAADVRLLDDVSRQVAAAAHAVQLAADLQRSRERLVLAREEERRRLRRDLHDGVGSALAGLALQAGRARRAIDDAPDTAIERMAALEAGIRASVVDVRRIVDDLRPPALDDLGLGEALRERADALFDGRSVVSCDISDVALPAAVEVAAYRIGTEALTNSARHSGAASVEVRVQLGEGDRCLLIEVVDDGLGIGGTAEHGVGLGSMRERASELGGTCDIRSDAGTGTTVRAVLPLPRTQEGGHPHG
jgi:signal transduction histidine kinase